MDCHLIAVKVGVKGRAYQGMELDGATIDKYWLKGLDAESVKGRGSVQ